jgi:hypothetical protein
MIQLGDRLIVEGYNAIAEHSGAARFSSNRWDQRRSQLEVIRVVTQDSIDVMLISAVDPTTGKA